MNEPLTFGQRVSRYHRQTRGPLTARQRRRVKHKANRALRPLADIPEWKRELALVAEAGRRKRRGVRW